MTQTASVPRGPRHTVSVPAAAAPAQPDASCRHFDAAAMLAPAFGGGPIAPQFDALAASASGDHGDVLAEVWRTSSYLEGKQWELDNANEALRQAVQKASAAGAAQDELCTAANLTPEELAAVLKAALSSPAAIRP